MANSRMASSHLSFASSPRAGESSTTTPARTRVSPTHSIRIIAASGYIENPIGGVSRGCRIQSPPNGVSTVRVTRPNTGGIRKFRNCTGGHREYYHRRLPLEDYFFHSSRKETAQRTHHLSDRLRLSQRAPFG